MGGRARAFGPRVLGRCVVSTPASKLAWLKLANDGTNLNFYSSSDGVTWGSALYTVSRASSFIAATEYNYLGVVIQPQTSAMTTILKQWTVV